MRNNEVLSNMIGKPSLEQLGRFPSATRMPGEAPKALAKESFVLILMDMQMPELDGIEAAHVIRRQEEGTPRHIPMVALAANAMEGDRERFLKEGFDYLSKPSRLSIRCRALKQSTGTKPTLYAAGFMPLSPPAWHEKCSW